MDGGGPVGSSLSQSPQEVGRTPIWALTGPEAAESARSIGARGEAEAAVSSVEFRALV